MKKILIALALVMLSFSSQAVVSVQQYYAQGFNEFEAEQIADAVNAGVCAKYSRDSTEFTNIYLEIYHNISSAGKGILSTETYNADNLSAGNVDQWVTTCRDLQERY